MKREEIEPWLEAIHEDDGSKIEGLEFRDGELEGELFEFEAEGNPLAAGSEERVSLSHEDGKYRSAVYGETLKGDLVIIYQEEIHDYGQFVDLPNEHSTVMWMGKLEEAPAARTLVRDEYERNIASEVAMDIQRITMRLEAVSRRNIAGYAHETITQNAVGIMRKIA